LFCSFDIIICGGKESGERDIRFESEARRLGSLGTMVGGYTRPFAKCTAQALIPSIARILKIKNLNLFTHLFIYLSICLFTCLYLSVYLFDLFIYFIILFILFCLILFYLILFYLILFYLILFYLIKCINK
jgi:hypothetical protein